MKEDHMTPNEAEAMAERIAAWFYDEAGEGRCFVALVDEDAEVQGDALWNRGEFIETIVRILAEGKE
jgi:hypothetical protein